MKNTDTRPSLSALETSLFYTFQDKLLIFAIIITIPILSKNDNQRLKLLGERVLNLSSGKSFFISYFKYNNKSSTFKK